MLFSHSVTVGRADGPETEAHVCGGLPTDTKAGLWREDSLYNQPYGITGAACQKLQHLTTHEKRAHRDFPGPAVKRLPCNAGDLGLTPGRGNKIPVKHRYFQV